VSFLELAVNRYSLRQFSNAPVEKEKLEKILEAGRIAPTACNKQPQSILVLQSPEALDKLKKCTRCHFDAPTALIVCYDKTASWKRPFDNKDHGDIDASIVCASMMFEAAELGLGTTWVCYFDPAAVSREFSLPENIIPSSILPLGYAADGAEPAPMHALRKPSGETVKII
jgi:nitroreductase